MKDSQGCQYNIYVFSFSLIAAYWLNSTPFVQVDRRLNFYTSNEQISHKVYYLGHFSLYLHIYTSLTLYLTWLSFYIHTKKGEHYPGKYKLLQIVFLKSSLFYGKIQ